MSISSAPARHDPDLDAFEHGLQTVLDERERIGLAFQPIVDLPRARVIGYEGLARFYAHPRATPDRWFTAASALGLAAELEVHVISRMLRQRTLLPPGCFLSVNVDPGAAGSEAVQRAFAASGDLAGIVIEPTGAPAPEHGLALAALRSAGALLAVHDPGQDGGAARQIRALRPDFVKLGHRLIGAPEAGLIATGVERDSELLRLRELGVQFAQGYRLGRPKPVMDALGEDVLELLAG